MDTPTGDVKVSPSSLRVVDFGSVRELFPIGTNVNPGDGFTVAVDGDFVAGETQTVITFHDVPPIIADFVGIVKSQCFLKVTFCPRSRLKQYLHF